MVANIADITKEENIRRIEINDCQNVLPKEIISQSRSNVKHMIKSGDMQCVESSDVQINAFSDGQGLGNQVLVVEFERCKDS